MHQNHHASEKSPRPRIRVRREWIGPPAGTLRNPTFWVFVISLALFGTTVGAYLSVNLPPVVATILNSLALYMAFTVTHESMHGVAHQNRTVNALLGRPMGLLLTFAIPVFRAVHYEHHSHTNDPRRDPDLFISRAPKWGVPIWAAGVMFEYRRHYYGRKLWRKRRELAEALVVEAFVLSAIILSITTGHFSSVFVLWLLPLLIAVVFLVVAFDYLPHYPYDSTERYHDTRIYPGRLAFIFLLGQNYHLIHHLWTTVPWYRYRRVFNQIRPELEAHGARIGWRVVSETPTRRVESGPWPHPNQTRPIDSDLAVP